MMDTLRLSIFLLSLALFFNSVIGSSCSFYTKHGLPQAEELYGDFSQSTRPNPSFALTNWKDMIMTWSGMLLCGLSLLSQP